MKRFLTALALTLTVAFAGVPAQAEAWRALKSDAVYAANTANRIECGKGWLYTCYDWTAPGAAASQGGYCKKAGYHSWYCYMGLTEHNILTASYRHVNTMAHVYHLGVIHFYRNGKRVF